MAASAKAVEEKNKTNTLPPLIKINPRVWKPCDDGHGYWGNKQGFSSFFFFFSLENLFCYEGWRRRWIMKNEDFGKGKWEFFKRKKKGLEERKKSGKKGEWWTPKKSVDLEWIKEEDSPTKPPKMAPFFTPKVVINLI